MRSVGKFKFDPNCICVFVYLYLCIWMSDTWEHCFWGPRIIAFWKIYHMLGLSDNLTQTVFVYLYICVFVYLCIYIFVYLYLCIWMSDTWEQCFWGPRIITFSKIYHMLGLSSNLTQTVFVYLCICICVFGCQTLGNIVFEVLVPSAFQKCITSWFFSKCFKVSYSATNQP